MWPLDMMYKEHYSPLGYSSKLDYWECKEESHDVWCKMQGQAEIVRETYLYYLEDSEDC